MHAAQTHIVSVVEPRGDDSTPKSCRASAPQSTSRTGEAAPDFSPVCLTLGAEQQELDVATTVALAAQARPHDPRVVPNQEIAGGEPLRKHSELRVRPGSACAIDNHQPRRAALTRRELRDPIG